MKYLRFLSITFLLSISATDQTRSEVMHHREDFAVREVRESLQRYGETLAQIDLMPPAEAIPKLGEMIVRTFRWRDEKSMDVFSRAQQKLLSIPGHAIYFRDKLKAAQAEVKAGRMTLDAWERVRINSFQTLQHMPSEETVEVLMEFVNDRFADLNSRNPEDYKDLQSKDPFYLAGITVRGIAAGSLEVLGIEPPPYKPHVRLRYEENLGLWNDWWEEVKAGKRKYRFRGSDVEHPVNTPPSAPRKVRRPTGHPGSNLDADTPGQTVSEVSSNEIEVGPKWVVFVGIAAVLSAVAAFFIKRRTRKSGL